MFGSESWVLPKVQMWQLRSPSCLQLKWKLGFPWEPVPTRLQLFRRFSKPPSPNSKYQIESKDSWNKTLQQQQQQKQQKQEQQQHQEQEQEQEQEQTSENVITHLRLSWSNVE